MIRNSDLCTTIRLSHTNTLTHVSVRTIQTPTRSANLLSRFLKTASKQHRRRLKETMLRITFREFIVISFNDG